MRKIAQQAVSDHNYSNEITRAIDRQRVIAPQYGVVGSVRPDPSNPPKKSTHRAEDKPNAGKSFNYDIRRERTRALKITRDILQYMLQDIDNGVRTERAHVVNLMRQRLQLMNSELARRNLRDLAGGKMRNCGSFYSLGARARAA